MKAVQFSEFGGPEVLRIVDLPDPHAGPGQVRIVVHAAGVSPTDVKAREGLFGGDLPQTVGRDVAGVVDEVGEGVTGVAVGERVFGVSDDGAGAAELTVSSHFAAMPPGLDFVGAAALPVAVGEQGRAFYALDEVARLVAAGRFSLPVERTFPLADIAEVHRLSEQGHVRGRLVLVVR